MARRKIFKLTDKITDKNGQNHTIMVVGELTQKTVKKDIVVDVPVETKPKTRVKGELKFKQKMIQRDLAVGLAICQPCDRFDEELGERVALRHIRDGKDIGKLTTNSVTMLTDDLVQAILFTKLYYIKNHIAKYVKDDSLF